MSSVDNDSRWDRLNDVYRRKGLVIALGSGVSRASHIPIWEELLIRTGTTICNPIETSVLHKLIGCRFSFQVLASFLEEHSAGTNQRLAFISALREALYADFFAQHGLTRPVDFSMGSPARKHFIEKVRQPRDGNTTLRTVGAMCAVKNEQAFEPNPNIHAVVTLNIDWLLQAFVRAHFNVAPKRNLIRTIDRPSATASSRRIPVYHVHGLVRFDAKQDDPKKEAADRVVLTEQDYFDVFNDPLSIFNYTVLHLLREHSCLFIGLSMTDENVRRLLHCSKRERVKSLGDEKLTDQAEIRRKVTRHFAILKQDDPRWTPRSKTRSLVYR